MQLKIPKHADLEVPQKKLKMFTNLQQMTLKCCC